MTLLTRHRNKARRVEYLDSVASETKIHVEQAPTGAGYMRAHSLRPTYPRFIAHVFCFYTNFYTGKKLPTAKSKSVIVACL